jgi:hypothetical protein
MFKTITKKILLFLLLFVLVPAIAFSQPTEEEILARIESGLDWLVPLQQPDGSWTESGEPIAVTGFVLTKLCDYAIEHGYSPFDPAYEYNSEVVAGFNYIFNTIKTHGAGTGMCATPALNYGHEIYNAAVALMALAASKSPLNGNGRPPKKHTGSRFSPSGGGRPAVNGPNENLRDFARTKHCRSVRPVRWDPSS